jgi:hypothetical protein
MSAHLPAGGAGIAQARISVSAPDLLLCRRILLLEQIVFKSCSDEVRAIIEFVAADRADQFLKTQSH